MAARRSSNSRSRAGRNRRPAPSSPNHGVMIGVGVAAVAILGFVVYSMSGKGDDNPKRIDPTADQAAAKPAPKVEAPVANASSKNRPAKVLKDPDTPAPPISAAVVSEAEALYAAAKKLHDDARRAQAAGDSGKFNELINDSWDKLEEIDTCLESYTMWLEEANMGDWRVPSEYAGLQRQLDKYDKLRGGVKRVKPNRR